MTKCIFICMIKWSAEAEKKNGEDPKYFPNSWMPKHEELMKKYGLKIAYSGTPFGVSEDACMIFEGGSDVSKYKEFREAVAAIAPGLVTSANTTIVSL